MSGQEGDTTRVTNTNSDDGYASDPGVKGPAYGYYVMGLLSRVDKGLLTWLAMPIQSSVTSVDAFLPVTCPALLQGGFG